MAEDASQSSTALPRPAKARAKVPGKGGLFQWLALQKKLSRQELAGVPWEPSKVLTLDEIAKHNTPDDCWMILRGIVYNVTGYLPYHPGGADELLRGAGRNGDQLFDDVHAWVNVDGFLGPCRVGVVASSPLAAVSFSGAPPRMQFLSGGARTPKQFETATLQSIEQVSHNTKLLHFTLSRPLKYTFGQHVKVQISGKGGRLIARPLSPLTGPESSDTLDLLVKVYPDGELSPLIDSMRPGEVLKYSLAGSPYMLLPPQSLNHVLLIAAGVGIAPFIPILRWYLEDKVKPPKVTLLFANSTEEDILMKDTFDKWTEQYSNFQVIYILSTPAENWAGVSGRISGDIVKRYLPASQVLVCGPVRMVNALCTTLRELGCSANQVVAFT